MVRGGVVNEPVVPVPPLPVEVHEVLLVDDQTIREVALSATKAGVAEIVTVGGAEATVMVML